MAPEPPRSFVGRRRELAAADAALRRALAGRPGIVLLTGEPGIGKTRTAQQIAAQAEAQGVDVLWARCPEEPGAPPYWPWLQLLRRHLARLDERALPDVVGAAAPVLAGLDAALAARLGAAAATPDDADAAQARFRLFDAIAGFWQRAAARQPLLLVVDDLHRADVPSLRLLEFVMAEAGASRLLLLGTYRDAELTRQHPLSDTLAGLHRHGELQRLLLGGFSVDETAQFVAAAGAGDDAAEIAALLHEQTEGHPLFLAELARELPQRRASGGARDRRPRVPSGVREVIGARLNRMAPDTVELLRTAAAIGREFRAELLRALLDRGDEACLAALEEARAASLIGEAAEPGAYQFSHALVRDTLYDEIAPARRVGLHRRIAAALEQLYADDATPVLSALAHHYHAAGPAEVDKAIEFATRAAEQASAMHAHEEAVRHYASALAALPPAPAGDARRCALLLALGHAQNCAGTSALALGSFEAAAAAARRLGEPALLARAAIGFGDAQWRVGDEGSAAARLIEEALARQPADADPRRRISLLAGLCRAQLFANRPDAAEQAFRDAVAAARRLDEPGPLFEALSAILPGRWFPERLALRIDAAREAITLARRAGHPDWAVPYLSGWHTGDLMEAGDVAEATRTAQLHLATGETRREPFIEAVGLVALAMIATHEGRFADAEPLAAQALACGSRFDRANAAGIHGVQMFTLRRQQGRLGEVAPLLRLFLERQQVERAWAPGLALLQVELGALDGARALFEPLAAGDFDALPRDAILSASLAYLAEVCAALGDRPRAAVLYRLLAPHAGRNIVFGAHTASLGAADRLLGLLAATLQRWDEAEAHFDAAIEFDRRTGGRPWQARSQAACAAMLLRRGAGDGARAQPLLAAAGQTAQALGMRGLAAEVAALREAAPAPGAPAGLSEREVEVLRWVAAGKTNQEIAALLFRSPNTVANHVRSILGKTQAANRAEASAFAVRHGLLPPRERAP